MCFEIIHNQDEIKISPEFNILNFFFLVEKYKGKVYGTAEYYADRSTDCLSVLLQTHLLGTLSTKDTAVFLPPLFCQTLMCEGRAERDDKDPREMIFQPYAILFSITTQ